MLSMTNVGNGKSVADIFLTRETPTQLNNAILIEMDDFMRRHCSDDCLAS